MGSVVEMRAFRAVLLAIIATVALLGGIASTAYAGDGSNASGPRPAATDPGDPGLPPD
jgi:hypothetical protein